MANRNQPPLNTLPLPPLEHDVQYLNSLVRLLNNNFNAIKNPGASRVTAQVMTDAPTLPYDQNTGQAFEDGTVWNDEGFLKILPEGNPGNVNANIVRAFTAVETPLIIFDMTTLSKLLAYNSAVTALEYNAGSLTSPSADYIRFGDTGRLDITDAYYVDSIQVVTNQQAAIPDATSLDPISVSGSADLITGAVTGTATTSSNVVDTVNSILSALRAHGLIAT